MRLTILTHYYPPEVGAPQARLSTLARELAERGVEVTVHTGFPHYPDGEIKPPYKNRPWLEERDGAVRVVRSLVYPAANRGFGRRLASHLSLASSAVATARRAGPADVVLVETPPLFTAAAGVAYSRLLRAPLILHVSDRWPASAVQLGALRHRRAIALAERLEAWCYRHAAAIVVPTAGLLNELGALQGAGGKVTRIAPGVDTRLFKADPLRHSGDRPLRVLYAGTVGLAQNLGTLVDAARIAGDAVDVSVAGDGADEPALRDRLAREHIENVALLGRVPRDDVPALYAQADAAVVLLRDRPLFRGALPTKMFEAMAAGRPLVVSASGEAAELVESYQCGIVVRPEDPEALAGALRGLAERPESDLRAMGEAGVRAAELHDVSHAVDRWQDLLERVAAPSERSN